FFVIASCAPLMLAPNDTVITLVVNDPDALFAKPNYNRGLIKASCGIKDNRTNPTVQDPYNIISIVDKMKNVTWKIELPNDEYEGAIEFIEKKDGTSSQRNQLPFFDAKVLKGNGGIVQRDSNNNARNKKKYTYAILFSLEKGGVTRYYSIDPKLKGNN
ncbi:MAG: hypothetical protein HKO67_00660, partial [Flavobacteriaceae bacterium]|nr:hypothetical protein [Flavobacteriaceae bacterium]